MTWRSWFPLAAASLAAALSARPAAAQLAPTGGHYANQSSDGGFAGSVNSSGGYGASVPLELPGARGGLPIPVQIVYGEHGVGAAGLGWDVPMSFVRRDTTVAHRRPMQGADGTPQARERVSLVLDGRTLELVRSASGWVARRDAPDILVREQGDGTWVMFDGRGQTYSFTTVSSALTGANLWLLKTITGVGGSQVSLDYNITTPTVSGGTGLAIDLASVSYNPHPTTANCFKNQIVLGYDSALAAPLSLSMLGDRILARVDKLTKVDVYSKATCGDANVRLRGYTLGYQADVDTQLPRLHSVQVVGRDGTPEAATPIPVASYDYGHANSGGVFGYVRGFGVAASAFVKPATKSDPSVMPPGQGFSTWSKLLDITGDGIPDNLQFNGSSLKFLRDWTHPGTPQLLSDGVLTNRPIETRTVLHDRY